MKLPPRPQTRRLLAGIAVAACLTGVIAASGVSAQAATIDNPNLSWAKTADLQAPATALPTAVGTASVDQSQIGAGLPTGVGTAGQITRYVNCAPAAGAVTTSSIYSGNNSLNNGGFPVPNMGYSAILQVDPSVIPGTVTSGFNVDLLNDPAFKECSMALNLAGPVYVGASSASTGSSDNNYGNFRASETGSSDGKVSVTANPNVPDATAFGADVFALTKSGTQVRIGLSFETLPNGYWDSSLTAPGKVFDATVGQPLTITPSQMRAGAAWQGGSIDTLTPTLSNTPAGSSLLPGGGLAYTPTAAGNVPFSYRLGNGASTTQLLPATIRVSAGTPTPVAPTVTSLDPNHGPTAGGNPVAISGTNLDPTCTVTFDGIPAGITSGTATVLNVTAPAHSAGLVDVVVTCNGQTAAPIGYTYEDPIAPPAPGPTPPIVPGPTPPVVPAPTPPVVSAPKPAPPKLPVVSG